MGVQNRAPSGFDFRTIQPVVSSNVLRLGSYQVFMLVVDQMIVFFWVYALYGG